MIYVFIAVLVGVAFFILQKQKLSNNKRDIDEMQLVSCAKCGVYISQSECQMKHGKPYCNECKE